MADANENRDRITTEIIKSSSLDSEIEQALQRIKETSSSEEEVATTPAVAGAGEKAGVGAEAQISVEAGVGAESEIEIGLEAEVEAPVEVTEGGTSDERLEELYRDFTARRAGVINALTSGFEMFYKCCSDQDEVCLYGLPDQSWNVKWPTGLSPQVPKPTLGINLYKDLMPDDQWRLFVADESDKWLTEMISFVKDANGLDPNSRMKLDDMTNGLGKVHQAVESYINQSTSKRSPREEDSSAGGSKRARRMK